MDSLLSTSFPVGRAASEISRKLPPRGVTRITGSTNFCRRWGRRPTFPLRQNGGAPSILARCDGERAGTAKGPDHLGPVVGHEPDAPCSPCVRRALRRARCACVKRLLPRRILAKRGFPSPPRRRSDGGSRRSLRRARDRGIRRYTLQGVRRSWNLLATRAPGKGHRESVLASPIVRSSRFRA